VLTDTIFPSPFSLGKKLRSNRELFFVLVLLTHLFFFNLLAYNSYAGGHIVTFTYALAIYPSRIPPLHLSLPPLPHPRVISTGFIPQFSYVSSCVL
jgi:hypothetical protein